MKKLISIILIAAIAIGSLSFAVTADTTPIDPEQQMWMIVDAARGYGEISWDYAIRTSNPADGIVEGRVVCNKGDWSYYIRQSTATITTAGGIFTEISTTAATPNNRNNRVSIALQKFTSKFADMTRANHIHDSTWAYGVTNAEDKAIAKFEETMNVSVDFCGKFNQGFYFEGYGFAKVGDSKITFNRTATSMPILPEGVTSGTFESAVQYDSWREVPYAIVNSSAYKSSLRQPLTINDETGAYQGGGVMGNTTDGLLADKSEFMLFLHNNDQTVENSNRDLRGIIFDGSEMKVSNLSIEAEPSLIPAEQYMWQVVDAARGYSEVNFEYELEDGTTGLVECIEGKWDYYTWCDEEEKYEDADSAIVAKLEHFTDNFINMTRSNHAHNSVWAYEKYDLRDNLPAFLGDFENDIYYEGYGFAKVGDSKINFNRTTATVPALPEGQMALVQFNSWAEVPYSSMNSSAYRNSLRHPVAITEGVAAGGGAMSATTPEEQYMLFLHNNDDRVLRGIMFNGEVIKVDNFKAEAVKIQIIGENQVQTPFIMSPTERIFTEQSVTVFLDCATPDATIFYTINEDEPCIDNGQPGCDDTLEYNPSIGIVLNSDNLVNNMAIIQAVAVKSGMTDSFVMSELFTRVAPIINVTGVSLNKSTLPLAVGGFETLTATVTPENATNKGVIWSSSNTAVATINNGTVIALSAGTTTITVKTEDGGFEDECVVTVVGGNVEYRLGRIRGNDIEIGINDALQVLMRIAKISSSLIYTDTTGRALKASLISNPKAEVPTISDALQILMYLAKIKTGILWKLYN